MIGALFSYVIACCAHPYFGIRTLDAQLAMLNHDDPMNWCGIAMDILYDHIKKLFDRFDDCDIFAYNKPVYEQRTSQTHFLL